ncbi:hypothetical protein PFISCL1PPCAC_28103 [Pristionchus fissidentatus]|uniref:Cytochrome P450 n=1 Tax=Pristionchus fissidentatus TaxID=1538716 RepID=A0AAV5WXK1_9BILA|nr:hypothetical protein PFISCL1PPCAC_28103 [Pristionchus fissidentatus]
MIWTIIGAVAAIWLFHQLYWRTRAYPPGPIPLPLLGNVLSILFEYPGYAPLARWKEKFGSIYTMWMGTVPIVTVNDFDTLHEIFVQDGESYADRASLNNTFNEIFRGGQLGVIETSGQIWREQRRFTLHTLRDFGLGKDAMQERILNEAVCLLDLLEKESIETGTTWPIKHLEKSVGSVINLVIFGYRFDEEHEHELLRNRELQEQLISAAKNPLLTLPILFPKSKIIPYLNRLYDNIINIRDEQFAFFEKNIEKHRSHIDYSNDDCDDFCDAYLKEMERRKDEEDSSFHEKQFVNVCLDLWSAGMETTAMTMSWGTALLLHHPEVQRKLHEEYDRVIGSDRLISMQDKNSLPYTTAYINELQRWANILPLNLLRKTTKEITIKGVRIPSDTAIAPQISMVMYDPEVFPDPMSFNPDRFIDESGKVKTIKQFLPFSIGKRACLGEGLARMELFLFFANLVHRFNITPKDSESLPSLLKTFANVTKPAPFEVKLERRFAK